VDLWARWKLLDELPDICGRVLVLGLDTMIRGDVSLFYQQEMGENLFSATPDMWINTTDQSGWPEIASDMRRFHMDSTEDYINGDVVLVNLEKCRRELSFPQFIDFQARHQFTCWDQDIINYCFPDRLQRQADYSFNYFPHIASSTAEDYDRAVIVHFAGGPKPWNVSPWRAAQYVGVSEWWANADALGTFSRMDLFRLSLRDLKSGAKRALSRGA
jgi:lipopolysaccharide biosynthesis glycosyltransferase